MRVTATTDAPRDTGADTVALGIFEGEDVAHDLDGAPLQALLDSGEAKRGFKKLALTHAGGKRWLLVGLGARERFDGERARIAAATALGRAQETGARTLCWELPH
jgi:leucyl aminopeptidase